MPLLLPAAMHENVECVRKRWRIAWPLGCHFLRQAFAEFRQILSCLCPKRQMLCSSTPAPGRTYFMHRIPRGLGFITRRIDLTDKHRTVTEALFAKVVEWAGGKGRPRLYDACSGAGVPVRLHRLPPLLPLGEARAVAFCFSWKGEGSWQRRLQKLWFQIGSRCVCFGPSIRPIVSASKIFFRFNVGKLPANREPEKKTRKRLIERNCIVLTEGCFLPEPSFRIRIPILQAFFPVVITTRTGVRRRVANCTLVKKAKARFTSGSIR